MIMKASVETQNRKAIFYVRFTVVLFALSFIMYPVSFAIARMFWEGNIVVSFIGCIIFVIIVLSIVGFSIYGLRCACCPKCGRRIADTVYCWRKLFVEIALNGVPVCKFCKALDSSRKF